MIRVDAQNVGVQSAALDETPERPAALAGICIPLPPTPNIIAKPKLSSTALGQSVIN
jgi:hypothetical protein